MSKVGKKVKTTMDSQWEVDEPGFLFDTGSSFSPDFRTVPGVLLPPPGVPGAPVPAFFVSRLLKKLASTPSLV